MTDKIISIKDIVKTYNISYSAINYYTNIGLLPVVKRSRNTRYYIKEQVEERLKKISELKDKGYPLVLIKKELA